MAGEPYPLMLPDIVREMCELDAKAPLTPSQLRRYFVLLLRSHWSSDSNHGPDLKDTLSCLTWSDDGTGRLSIGMQGSAADDRNKPYSIWIKLGGFRFSRKTFGSRSENSEDNSVERFVWPTSFQLLIAHEAPDADQAFDMAWSTLCFMAGFKEHILASIGDEGASMVPQVLGEPEKLESPPKGRFRVDVGYRLDINVAVAATVESHKLKAAAVEIIPTL